MPTAGFTPPRQWEDWCSWALGIWLCISPWALRFEVDATATQTAVISGVLVILAEVITLSAYRAWEEAANVLLGLWLIAVPWILEITSSTAAAEFVIIGLLVLGLAVYEITQVRGSHGKP